MMTPEEFMAKLSWEGGIDALVSYGIDPTDVPEEIRGEWEAAAEAIKKFEARREALLEKDPGWEHQ